MAVLDVLMMETAVVKPSFQMLGVYVTRQLCGEGGFAPPPTPLTLAANEVMARPVPPTHGSNPAWMLVRYHESATLLRVFMSLMKSRTLKFQLVIGDGATYETTSLEPLLPDQTSQVRPPMVVAPV